MEKDRIQARIILFNSEGLIDYDDFIEKEDTLTPIRFIDKIEAKFNDVKRSYKHIDLKDKGKDFLIYVYDKEELTTDLEVDVYGEEGLLKMIELAKENNWQIFDIHLQIIIDLDFPKKYKYEDYKEIIFKKRA